MSPAGLPCNNIRSHMPGVAHQSEEVPTLVT